MHALLSTWEVLAVNLLLLAFDLRLLWRLRTERTIGGLVGGLALTLAASLSLMAAGTGTVFGVMQLLSWALFVHGPALILAGAVWIPRARWLALLPLASTLVGLEAFVREPQALGVTELTLPMEGLKESLRVLLIADLQTDHMGDYEREALAQAVALEPDLVLWAGDYVQVFEPVGYARELQQLLLAGHTHGGQIQLPGIGPLMTLSRVPRDWASGVTRLSSTSTLVVSRGVGMERADAPRLRLLCEPELVLITLVPAG